MVKWIRDVVFCTAHQHPCLGSPSHTSCCQARQLPCMHVAHLVLSYSSDIMLHVHEFDLDLHEYLLCTYVSSAKFVPAGAVGR
jgi:hypothetical protein